MKSYEIYRLHETVIGMSGIGRSARDLRSRRSSSAFEHSRDGKYLSCQGGCVPLAPTGSLAPFSATPTAGDTPATPPINCEWIMVNSDLSMCQVFIHTLHCNNNLYYGCCISFFRVGSDGGCGHAPSRAPSLSKCRGRWPQYRRSRMRKPIPACSCKSPAEERPGR